MVVGEVSMENGEEWRWLVGRKMEVFLLISGYGVEQDQDEVSNEPGKLLDRDADQTRQTEVLLYCTSVNCN